MSRKIHLSYFIIPLKPYLESGEPIRISAEGEGAIVLHQYFTDEDEADALSVGLR